MRTHYCTLLLSLVYLIPALFLFVPLPAAAQTPDDLICGPNFDERSGSSAGFVADGDTVHTLIALIKFKDDNHNPAGRDDWPLYADPSQLPPFAAGLIDSDPDPATFRDSTLSRYFYDQSRQGSGPGRHTLYGDVVPFVHETMHDQAWYDSTGLGYAAKEVLDRIFPDTRVMTNRITLLR